MLFRYTIVFPNTPPRPYLDVVLRNGFFTTSRLTALVDSGADYSIFPSEMAAELKLDLTGAPLWRFSGTTGAMQEARLAEVSLSVLEEDDERLAFEIKAVCAFCSSFKFSGGGLLGQHGFFSKFKTTFYQPFNSFEIDVFDLGEQDSRG